MFVLILFLNAVTDQITGYVYDIGAVALMITALLTNRGMGLEFPLVMVMLLILLILDKDEKYLGHGDYPILLSISLYLGDRFPHMLIIASISSLIMIYSCRRKSIPLVPNLFIGTLICDLLIS